MSLPKLTKYCACREKLFPWLIFVTHETLFTLRRATCVIVQTHQILRLPQKMTVQNLKEICWKLMKCHLQCATDPRPFRPWSDHETVSPQPALQPSLLFTHTTSILYWKIQHFALRLSFQISPNTAPATKSDTSTSPNTAPATKSDSHDESSSHMKSYLQCAEQHVSLSKLTKYCTCHAKWLSWWILVTQETLFTMRGATGVIVQTHQILRLPRKMTLMMNPRHTWNAIYNARSNRCHCPNSPNTAHDESSSHMKRYLQCAEQQVSLSKLTKNCACHTKWDSKMWHKFGENRWNVIYNARPIRAWSDHETVSPQPASQPSLLFTPTTSISQIFQSTLVLFDPKKIEVFFSKKLEVFSSKK